MRITRSRDQFLIIFISWQVGFGCTLASGDVEPTAEQSAASSGGSGSGSGGGSGASPVADQTQAAFPAQTTNTGAYVTKLPLAVPEGLPDLTPDLALTYSSQQDVGLAGVGWTIGLPAITLDSTMGYRVPSVTQDLALHAINGEPLERYVSPHGPIAVQQSGSNLRFFLNPHDGTNVEVTSDHRGSGEYSHGDVSAWSITTTDGRRYRYGHRSGASVARIYNRTSRSDSNQRKVLWMLDEVSDPSGNKMTYHYTERPVADPNVRQPVLEAIEYGIPASNPTTTEAIVVSFQYIPSPHRRLSYALGTRLDEAVLLDRVCVHTKTRWALVKASGRDTFERCYDLEYDFETLRIRAATPSGPSWFPCSASTNSATHSRLGACVTRTRGTIGATRTATISRRALRPLGSSHTEVRMTPARTCVPR